MICEIEIFFLCVFFYALCILNPPPPQRIRILTIVENRIFFFHFFFLLLVKILDKSSSPHPPCCLRSVLIQTLFTSVFLSLSFSFLSFLNSSFPFSKAGEVAIPVTPSLDPPMLSINHFLWGGGALNVLNETTVHDCKFISGEISLMLKFNDLF